VEISNTLYTSAQKQGSPASEPMTVGIKYIVNFSSRHDEQHYIKTQYFCRRINMIMSISCTHNIHIRVVVSHYTFSDLLWRLY
jgi:hypothetical protein